MDVNLSASSANIVKQAVQPKEASTAQQSVAKISVESSKTSALRASEARSVFEGNTALKPYLTVSDKALLSAIEHINKVLTTSNINVQYSFHKATNSQIIKIVDNETHQVIKEIPPEKVLDAFVEKMKVLGLYLDERG